MTQSITASVGEGGTNHRLDVAIVQLLLASAGIPEEAGSSPLLAIDGFFGTDTGNAIRQFQRVQFQLEDGLVQPSDFTMKRLNALADHFIDPDLPGSPCGLKHFALLTAGLDLGDLLGPAEVRPDLEGVVQRWSLGSIYHHPLTGAFEVHGAILGEYLNMGEELSALGYPISDERDWLPTGGRVSHFQFGSLFFTAAEGVTVGISPGI